MSIPKSTVVKDDDHWVDALSAAIVEQAIWDYEDALVCIRDFSDPAMTETIIKRKRKNKVSYEEADQERCQRLRYWYRMKKDCEEFFQGQWFEMLCDLDGERIMQEIQKRINVQEM